MATEKASGLFYLSLNESCSETVILIHSFSATHREYAFVWPHLSDYHVLLPDLPRHGGSMDIPLDTLGGTADLVADLIRSKAHGGQAHVVGLSMGGAVSLLLAQRHPDVISTLFVTGVAGARPGKRQQSWLRYVVPIALAMVKPLLYLPRPFQRWVCRRFAHGMQLPDGLVEDVRKNLRFSTSKRASSQIRELDFSSLNSLAIRTIVVAGDLHDSVKGARLLGQTVHQGNPDSCAITIPGGIHTWDMQFPLLFAGTVKAWIKHALLPEECKPLK